MSWWKTYRRVIALAAGGLLWMVSAAEKTYTMPLSPHLACEGTACAGNLNNSGAMTPTMTGSGTDGTKDPKHLLLDGDAKLACECLLCLSAGALAPKECQAALAKYSLIQAASPFQTMIKRRNFLQLCPKK